MNVHPSVREALLAAVPNLRAFAISLCGNIDRADDLVQETLVRALANIHSFERGTNMSAWLFTILRNLFRSEYRKRRREVEDADGSYAERMKSQPEQTGRVEFTEFREALSNLPPDQREALILVGASGFSYEEAAEICECAVGTIKSRVNRARTRLAELMEIESTDDSARIARPGRCSPAMTRGDSWPITFPTCERARAPWAAPARSGRKREKTLKGAIELLLPTRVVLLFFCRPIRDRFNAVPFRPKIIGFGCTTHL